MKAWLRFFALAALAAAFAGSIWFFRRAPDPLFEGKLASQWCEELLSPDYKVQNSARQALHSLGEAAVPQLRLMLRHRNPPWEPRLVRLARYIPGFQYKVRDSILSRQQAAQVAAGLGPSAAGAVPELIAALGEDKVAPDAARALVKIGPASEPALLQTLDDHRDPVIRTRSARLLGERFPASPAAAGVLMRATEDPAWEVRRQAALSLALMRTLEPAVETVLLGLLADPDPPVRAAAATALGKRENPAPEIQARLRKSMVDRLAEVRLASAKALWRLGENSAEVLPVLVGILQTDHAWEAAYALADLRAGAAPAIPHLIAALRRERVPRPYRTPPSSAFALGAIGPPAVPALSEVLSAPQPHIRLAAVLALGFMGDGAKPAVPALLPLLEDDDTEVRYAAALTLGTLGTGSPPVISALVECLAAEDIYMRFAAADLLRKFQPEGDWSASE